MSTALTVRVPMSPPALKVSGKTTGPLAPAAALLMVAAVDAAPVMSATYLSVVPDGLSMNSAPPLADDVATGGTTLVPLKVAA